MHFANIVLLFFEILFILISNFATFFIVYSQLFLTPKSDFGLLCHYRFHFTKILKIEFKFQKLGIRNIIYSSIILKCNRSLNDTFYIYFPNKKTKV